MRRKASATTRPSGTRATVTPPVAIIASFLLAIGAMKLPWATAAAIATTTAPVKPASTAPASR